MSDPDGHWSLILHPITHDVYRVPLEAIRNDCNRPAIVPRDAFEPMARLGCVSATTFTQLQAAITHEHVLTVRLKGEHGEAPPMYAWASRMCTLVDEDARGDGRAMMGQEFLWLWPQGKAWNAWSTRRERLRLTAEAVAWGIDACEPSLQYMARYPGLMLGPDDIDGCVHVPLEALTATQRFFVACIKPQQTLFARRTTAQDWTDRVTRMTDEAQERFNCGAYKRRRLDTPIKQHARACMSDSESKRVVSVSYTHLTLPTILLV